MKNKIKITIDRFIKLKNDLKRFRMSAINGKDKIFLTKKYGLTSDELLSTIEFIAYEKSKMSKV